MPRQIIDVETSRPAYVRRRIMTFVVVIVLVGLAAAAAWLYLSHTGAPLPGNSVR